MDERTYCPKHGLYYGICHSCDFEKKEEDRLWLTGRYRERAETAEAALAGFCKVLGKEGDVTMAMIRLQEILARPEDASALRAKVIMECRGACLEVLNGADEASKAKDVVENYRCGYIDAAVDCDEALFQMLRVPQTRDPA